MDAPTETERTIIGRRGNRPIGVGGWLAFLAWMVIPGVSAAIGADLGETETLYRTGRYEECARAADQEIDRGTRGERWYHLKINADLAQGKYEDALTSFEWAARRFPGSVTLLLLGRDVYRLNGKPDEAKAALEAIEGLFLNAPQRYATAEGRVALGRFFLLRGLDAKKILDQFFDLVIKQQPEFVEAYLASAELALEKQDGALAAETLRKTPKASADDPRYFYLLARALEDGDRSKSIEAIAGALKLNPRHVDSLLFQADDLIDGERYVDAAEVLGRVLAINPVEARAWAYKAVLAHLSSDKAGEESAYKRALEKWPTNPEVEFLIGKKLSRKYRFAEGSAHQKKALEFDPTYRPAKVQLCQDLLRLGEEDAGWKLADEVFAEDAYNVLAFNLTNLRDRLAGFRTIQDGGFLIRMDPKEADLYGHRVLELLKKAKKTLGEKYGVELPDPVIVEIFPQKKEFAIRTFGLPGGDGLLGVCFGKVITANSPASQGESPTNWESVLWHELCHVVTLSKTRNKMPRWLSEGISVYEEETQDPAWSSGLNPHYREMILGDSLTPLSKLSSAFLAPRTALHLQFAYFESALAVEFLVDRAGLPALKGILDDLGNGIPLNEALPTRSKMTLDQLDAEFASFARRRAEAVAPGATWEQPELPADADSGAISAWLEKHPKSFYGLRRLGSKLVAEGKWEKAKEAILRFKTLDPDFVGAENAYVLLAAVYRKTADHAAEHAILEELATRDGNALPAYQRLVELDESSGDWKGVARNARRMLAVNPLIPGPHRRLAAAAETLGDRGEAVLEYQALALIDGSDPAGIHYHLATLLNQEGKRVEAKREVLKSLEAAPRFVEAHKLLLDLADRGPDKKADDKNPADTTDKKRRR